MAVTETLRALGGWSLQLVPEIPREVWDALTYFGHIAIHAGPVDPRRDGDALLTSARYVGVLRDKTNEDTYTLGGPGMAMWLGDEDDKGPVIESLLTINNLSFENTLRAILPPASSAILEGTYFNIGQNFTGTFQFVTQRQAVDYVTSTLGADWRVRGTGHLDAGLESSLFVTNPVAAVLRRDSGVEMAMRAFSGTLGTAQDVQDFTTRVVLLEDDGAGGFISVADADILPGLNPYKDVHGAAVRMTRMINETATDPTNADARAQLQLNRFTGTRDALTLSTDEYDLKGTVAVGDYLWVYDPEMKLYDNATQVIFRGVRINPLKLRLTEMTWPIIEGMSIAYRNENGVWFDLTRYLIPESGETALVVGGYSRSLTGEAGGGGSAGSAPTPDVTVPGTPTWDTTNFLHGVYQSPINGDTKAQSELRWFQPLNLDGSTINDGDHYEIRYRQSSTPLFAVTHTQLAAFTHAQLAANGGTFGQPLHYAVGEWQYQIVPFDKLRVILYELTASMPYEAQIRAVDAAQPPNAGAWSVLTAWQTAADSLAPSTPAPPVVAASLIAVEITHFLGKSGGGTFNLERDLHHFEVHAEYEPGFHPSDLTLVGKLIANAGMIVSQIPVIGTFGMPQTTAMYFKVVAVDASGNKSLPSAAAVATAQLIDDAHIASLTVSKLTAGTVTASYVHAGWMRIGAGAPGSGAGPAIELTPGSIQCFNDIDGLTFNLDGATGNVLLSGTVTGKGLTLEGALGGNLKVVDSGGVQRLHASSSDVTMRDANGNAVFSNVTSSGWGITKPDLPYSMYPYGPWDATQVQGASWQTTWLFRIPVNHPKLAWGVQSQCILGGSTGEVRIMWSTADPPSTEFDWPGNIIFSRTGMVANSSFADSGTFSWPTDMFGDQVWIWLAARRPSGTGNTSISPMYFYGYAD